MQKLLNIMAQTWSVILYPMFMPFYGIIMFCLALQQFVSPPLVYTLVCILGTFTLTVLIPILLLVFMRKKGYIDSLQIEQAHQRTTPYIYTIICYGYWAFFLRVTMQLPLVIFWIAIGAIVAMAVVTIINHWWKISAHLTGLGGLIGGVCSFALYYNILPLSLILTLLIGALSLMFARLYLNAHTPMQVIAGLMLGLLCTFTPNLILFHA